MHNDIHWIDGLPQGRLAIMPRPRGGDWLPTDLERWRAAGLQVIVSLLAADEVAELELHQQAEHCERLGLEYTSFAIADRGIPIDAQELLTLVEQLDERLRSGYSVGIHCRMGIGRSSLVAACLLIRQGLRPDAAFQLISSSRGLQVPDTPTQADWVKSLAERLRPQ